MLPDLPPPPSHYVYQAPSIPFLAPQALHPLLQDLFERGQNHRKNPWKTIPIIHIAGCPGIGKTYLTEILKNALEQEGLHVAVIHFDDWTCPPENPCWTYFDFTTCLDFLEKLHDNERILNKPVLDQLCEEFSTETIDLRSIDLILFEGVLTLHSLYPYNFFQHASLGIFLDANRRDIAAWKWEREQKTTHPRTWEEFLEHIDPLLTFNDITAPFYKLNATYVITKESDHSYEVIAKPHF